LPRLLTLAVERVRASHRAEDASTMLTAVSAGVAALLAPLDHVPWWLKAAPAIVAAGAGLWALRAKRLRRMLFDKSIGAQAEVLADAEASVPRFITDLTSYLDPRDATDYSDRVESILERANTLFGAVNRATIEIER
jgi:hypothetical protein